MPFLVIAAVAGAILIILAVLFTLITITIRAEDRRARSILGPPPGWLAAAARRITGLHVRAVASGGPACHCQPDPARAALGAVRKRR
jgi:hypothetical protein